MGKGKVMGYKGASWKCYDGKTYSQDGQCQFSFVWQKYADASCKSVCG